MWLMKCPKNDIFATPCSCCPSSSASGRPSPFRAYLRPDGCQRRSQKRISVYYRPPLNAMYQILPGQKLPEQARLPVLYMHIFTCTPSDCPTPSAEPTSDNSDNCEHTFSFPSGCAESECEYTAKISRMDSDWVDVEVKQKQPSPQGYWTAIGFSNNRQMVRLQTA